MDSDILGFLLCPGLLLNAKLGSIRPISSESQVLLILSFIVVAMRLVTKPSFGTTVFLGKCMGRK